ncbi:hypothetical protein ACP70R_036822 [Stipagrostis hirtigluma subsp. patula]
MEEVSNGGVEEPPAPSTPSEQPATAAPVQPSAARDAENARTPVSDNADKTGATGGTGTQVEEKPASGTKPPSSPGTPERDTLPPPLDGGHANAVVEDVDAARPEGCTTPPPPAHDSESEGSDTHSADVGHGSPLRGGKPKPARAGRRRDVAAASNSKPMLLIFRSFSWDKKAKKSGDAAPPLSPGETRPTHGKHGGERKEKEMVRRKSFWK